MQQENPMLLADLASRPEAYPLGIENMARLVAASHKMVLTDETLELVMALRHQPPKVISDLRRQSRPPFTSLFVEADLQHYRRLLNFETPESEDGARTGLLILNGETAHSFLIRVIDSVGPVTRHGKVLNWPIMYGCSYTDEPLPSRPVVESLYEARVWGYTDDIDVRPLHSMAGVKTDENLPIKLAANAFAETAGILRYAVAVLSLLNGPATLHEPPQGSKGQRTLIHGRSHRLCTPTIIRIEVPKRVRDKSGYVLKAAREGAKKRLHEVRGHWRHVDHCPATAHAPDSGWEKGPDGRWRRWIAEHERGDETLGDLRGRVTVLTNPRRQG
jgi:hypothetical protein